MFVKTFDTTVPNTFFLDMADTMLQHDKVRVNLCVYTKTKKYTPIKSAIPQKDYNVWVKSG